MYPNRVPFIPFWTLLCAESVYSRGAVNFFGLDAKFRRESVSKKNSAQSGRNAQLVLAICAKLRKLRAKVWRAASNAILVRILTAEVFLRTSVLYLWRWLAVFLAFCCIAFCKGDLLSSFLPRVIFVSLRMLSAENQFEPGSYAVLLLWC